MRVFSPVPTSGSGAAILKKENVSFVANCDPSTAKPSGATRVTGCRNYPGARVSRSELNAETLVRYRFIDRLAPAALGASLSDSCRQASRIDGGACPEACHGHGGSRECEEANAGRDTRACGACLARRTSGTRRPRGPRGAGGPLQPLRSGLPFGTGKPGDSVIPLRAFARTEQHSDANREHV